MPRKKSSLNSRQARAAGGKLARSEVVTVRLDPKTKYAAELAARIQRRTISSFIEWAVECALKEVAIVSQERDPLNDEKLWDVMSRLWDVDEPDRLINLALRLPQLMNHEEQQIWKLIRINKYFWRVRKEPNGEYTWGNDLNSIRQDLIVERVRKHWNTIIELVDDPDSDNVIPEGPLIEAVE